ncbi:unnamed protein product [Caenorhabditis bovis]|uniref:Uncharacterized protein n=1 Tax=Caenorhabditis bovis TaxID=2654633 RepID=A0A8S1EZ56_9PELO|nr:unnamed protein product [Caenorhabditis bovis]
MPRMARMMSMPGPSEPTTSSGQPSSSAAALMYKEGCAVCGDKINGCRYGAPACLGCIVFFRRAVTNATVYKCLKGGQCLITNESRCICRYCRLRKCYDVGMKASAIQRRDVMGPRKPKPDTKVKQEVIDDTPNLKCQSVGSGKSSGPSIVGDSPKPSINFIGSLHRLQKWQTAGHRSFFAAREPMSLDSDTFFEVFDRKMNGDNFRRARAYDVNSMIRLAIVDSAQWANQFEPFRRLPLQDKKNILTEYSFTFMLVDQGFRTAQRKDDNFWVLQNGTFMHEDYFYGLPEEDAKLDQAQTKAKLHPLFIRESLYSVGLPMRQYKIDEVECAVLKTILLLGHKQHFTQSMPSVSNLMNRCLTELMEYCKSKDPLNAPERAGAVILITSSIRCTIKAVYNQTRVSDVFSLMKFDPLVRDVLLS